MGLVRTPRTVLVTWVFIPAFLWLASSAFAGSIVSWGTVVFDSAELAGNDFAAISAGRIHNLALKSDGSLVSWGDNQWNQATPPSGNGFAAIAASGSYNLALMSDGSILAWGSNGSGQATPPDGNDFVAIAAGGAHGLALRSDGSIIGWGANRRHGQATPPEGNDFVAIAAGDYHSLALRSDGSIVGWGSNLCGIGAQEPFDGVFCGQATPPDGNDFVAIAAGEFHSLALKSDGSIVGWGLDEDGQATAPAGNDFIAIAAGEDHSLALKSDGSIVGWGANDYGQATPPDGKDFVALTAGAYHSLALRADGCIVGWGSNHAQGNGEGYYASCWVGQATPPVGDDFVAIATATGGDVYYDGYGSGNSQYSLALKSDGSIVAWGANWSGQATPPDGNDFVAIAAGTYHSLALKSDGSIVAWGANWSGQATPPDGNDFVAIAAGYNHSLALKSDGSIVGWGANESGQATPPYGNDFVAIAAGRNHSLALESDGSIIGWGSNHAWSPSWAGGEEFFCGQASPPEGNDYIAIATYGGVSTNLSLALKSDGSIVAWGCDWKFQPTPPDGNDFVAVDVGTNHILALKCDRSILAMTLSEDWLHLTTPPEGNNFVAIAAGDTYSLAIRNTSGKYSGGTGEPNDPYQIATAADLMALGETPEDYDRHFILTADIDLDPNLPGGKVFDRAVIAPDWLGFRGVLDGKGHTISHLTIVGESNLGLFGYLYRGAKISNLGLEEVHVHGAGNAVGSLAGSMDHWVETVDAITKCYSTGRVSGDEMVGGLVGANGGGTIIASFSSTAVTGDDFVGGLVGSNGGYITNCYSMGTVTGNDCIGGLVGRNLYKGILSSWVGWYSVTGYYVGGVLNCYSAASVAGTETTGGAVGKNSDDSVYWFPATITGSYWDIETSDELNMCGDKVCDACECGCDSSYGKTTAEMKRQSTFEGWDFIDETENGTADIWWILEGQDYPRLWWER